MLTTIERGNAQVEQSHLLVWYKVIIYINPFKSKRAQALYIRFKIQSTPLKKISGNRRYKGNTSNGQAPFVTLFLNFNPNGKYAEYAALICEEVLKQRIQGVKNSDGIYVTPSFPKLIYCLDDHNINKDSKYYYLTELAAQCTAKRMYPDYISAKKMKELRDGEVYTCMG